MPYYFPLAFFKCHGEEYIFSKHLKIMIKHKAGYDLKKAENIITISKYYLEELGKQPFWAVVEGEGISHIDASIIVNRFLLALWIVTPIHAHVVYKFIDYDEAISFLDRFHSNEVEKPTTLISDEQMHRAIGYYQRLTEISERQKRLDIALSNTLYGCIPGAWTVGFMLYTAALEVLLTYSEAARITTRLGKSFACLTESKKFKRDRAYRSFVRSYNVRSDLVHGRGGKYRVKGKTREQRIAEERKNLKRLARCAALLRKLWQTVLNDMYIIKKLEKSDGQREIFFKTLGHQYNPPVMKIGNRFFKP